MTESTHPDKEFTKIPFFFNKDLDFLMMLMIQNLPPEKQALVDL